MAGQLTGRPYHRVESIVSCKYLQEEPHLRRWHFSRDEIENHSPSRKDGIDFEKESGLRKLYCSFLQELGVELKVPQVTIATAMILCHQFYMRQSHAKNHWQIIATACMFLACKAEETPRRLTELVVVSYKLVYKWDPSATRRIKEKVVYDKQKELILAGEELLLLTVSYELNIEHPYKPLVAAIKRLDIPHKELPKVSWNFLNDWLQTTLCLQYKPHYIAAGSLFLAAKLLKVKLPTEKGKTWWMQFDVSPKQLEDVVQQMLQLLEHNQRQAVPSKCGRSNNSVIGKSVSSNTESCISSCSAVAVASSSTTMVETDGLLAKAVSENGNRHSSTVSVSGKQNDHKPSTNSRCVELRHAIGREDGPLPDSVISKNNTVESMNERERLDTSDCGSANSIVEDGGNEAIAGESKQEPCKSVSAESLKRKKMYVDHIKETLKKMKLNRITSKKVNMDDEIDSEVWIERELENLE